MLAHILLPGWLNNKICPSWLWAARALAYLGIAQMVSLFPDYSSACIHNQLAQKQFWIASDPLQVLSLGHHKGLLSHLRFWL